MHIDESAVPPAKELVHPTPAVRLQSLDISASSKTRSVSDDSEISSGNKRKSADDSKSNSTSQNTDGTSTTKSDVTVSDRESSNSGALSKKRRSLGPLPKKREFSEPPIPLPPPILVDPLPGLALLNQIQAKNRSIVTKCASLGTSIGLDLEELFVSMEKENISQFLEMLIDCRRKGHLVDGEYGYRSAANLPSVVTKSYPALRLIPQGISSLMKEMARLINELLQSYIDAAVDYNRTGIQQPTEGVSDADIKPRPEPSMPILGKSLAQTAKEDDAEDFATKPPKTADN